MSAPANLKVVLVTGASSGIGQAIARHLAARGWRVFGTSRRETTGFDGVDMLPMDVDDDDSVTRAVSAIAEKTGRLDSVVNNAGWALMGPVEDTSIAEARAQMETNFFGVLRVCRAALPVMREQRSGHIVNISSLGGIFGIPFSGIYSAEYEREIMGKLAEMEREECRGQAAPKLDNPKKGAGDQKAGGRTPAPGSVPDQRSGPDRDRRDRCGNVQLVLSEYGTDVSMFPTEKQFVSHITLAPHKAMSGGQPVKKQKKRGSASSRPAAGLRMAALSLRNSKTALDAYYRHVAARKGGDAAVFATARKLATLIYRLLRWGQPYLDAGAAAYEKRCQEGRIKGLTASAKDLGYQLTPLATTA